LGSAYWIQGQNALAEQHYNESLEIGQANQDAIHIARCLVSLANVKGMAEDYLGAEKLYQQALEVFERMGHHAFMTVARGNLAAILWTRKEFDKARVHYEAVLEFYYAAGMLVDVIGSLNDLVWIDLEQKQFLTAQHRLAEALALGIRIQNDVRIVYTLLSIAWWKLEKGFVTEGAELLGLSINNPKMTAYLKKQAEETLFPRFLIHLTPEAFEAVLERGKSFDLKQTAHKLFVELSAGD
jgi:tetratricopeptide (TPR) repeat protein